jgi:hypothetical protein
VNDPTDAPAAPSSSRSGLSFASHFLGERIDATWQSIWSDDLLSGGSDDDELLSGAEVTDLPEP